MTETSPPSRPLPAADVALPAATPNHQWPTEGWSVGSSSPAADRIVDEAFDQNPNPALALSLAVVVCRSGEVVAERYGPDVERTTPLISWSTAKSMTHAALGIVVADGLIDIDEPAPVVEWADPADSRHRITLRHLLTMRSGLDFNEDYVETDSSHCLEMLFGEPRADMAHYAASQALLSPPGTVFNYSSGTTNIISRVVGNAVGGSRQAMDDFLRTRLFGPLGMTTADPRFDEAGTFVGSSYVYAAARDFAKFGELYLRDGVWDGRRLLPSGWVDLARTAVSFDETSGSFYGHHWWIWGDDLGTFGARGYEGQFIVAVPGLDLVIVRLGKTPIEHQPALVSWLRRLIDSFR